MPEPGLPVQAPLAKFNVTTQNHHHLFGGYGIEAPTQHNARP